jgi:hypothetical protein
METIAINGRRRINAPGHSKTKNDPLHNQSLNHAEDPGSGQRRPRFRPPPAAGAKIPRNDTDLTDVMVPAAGLNLFHQQPFPVVFLAFAVVILLFY